MIHFLRYLKTTLMYLAFFSTLGLPVSFLCAIWVGFWFGLKVFLSCLVGIVFGLAFSKAIKVN